MGPVHKTSVTLRFRGDALDPAELTERLGQVPTAAVGKGATWITARGEERLAKTGSWRLRMEPGVSADLDDMIGTLFDTLTKDLVVWRALTDLYNGNLFVGLFLDSSNEGLVLKPETALAIGSRGLALQLDIYGPGGG